MIWKHLCSLSSIEVEQVMDHRYHWQRRQLIKHDKSIKFDCCPAFNSGQLKAARAKYLTEKIKKKQQKTPCHKALIMGIISFTTAS